MKSYYVVPLYEHDFHLKLIWGYFLAQNVNLLEFSEGAALRQEFSYETLIPCSTI